MADKKAYEQAEKKVAERMDFFTHCIVYVIVNGFLVIVDLITSPNSWWVHWTMMGWGIGLLIHGANAFLIDSSRLRKYLMEKELAKMDKTDKEDTPKE